MSYRETEESDNSGFPTSPSTNQRSESKGRRNPRKSPNPTKRITGAGNRLSLPQLDQENSVSSPTREKGTHPVHSGSLSVTETSSARNSPVMPTQTENLPEIKPAAFAIPSSQPYKRQRVDEPLPPKSLKQTRLTSALSIGSVLTEEEHLALEHDAECRTDLTDAMKELRTLKESVRVLTQQNQQFQMESVELSRRLKQLQESTVPRDVSSRLLEKWCLKECLIDHKVVRERTYNNFYRLGQYTQTRSSIAWVDGVEVVKLNHEMMTNQNEIKTLTEEMSCLKRRMRDKLTDTKEDLKNDLFHSCSCSLGNECDVPDCPISAFIRVEQLNFRINCLKIREKELRDNIKQLEIEKRLHVKEIKRIRDEDDSKYRVGTVMSGRYLMMKLLGKGGYSEVWHAMDLNEFREVAIKINQIGSSWSTSKKESYVKHVKREFEIQSCLRHPNIVYVFGMVDLPPDGFAMILEYCGGNDLDHLLRERETIPEREARSIIIQIIAALLYLNESLEGGHDGQRKAVIHFDLKPANILFDNDNRVKISDFGLSKIMDVAADGSSRRGMDITSAGAGTYWYLPAECFRDDSQISDKVDVYSVGVIFYEMLYGRKPIGEGQSQETMIVFPPRPAVSLECQEFIQKCLTFDQVMRPSVKQISVDPYLVCLLKK